MEVLTAMAISVVLLSALAWHLVESARLSQRVTQTLTHTRNARELVDRLTADVRAAQILRLYPSFDDRSAIARDRELGNYLVLQQVDNNGTVTRTVGYYVTTIPGQPGWSVYRHDSAAGDSSAATLPAAATKGAHRALKRAVRLPDSGQLFRCVRDRGVSIYGEFGSPDVVGSSRTEFIRCTLLTRS